MRAQSKNIIRPLKIIPIHHLNAAHSTRKKEYLVFFVEKIIDKIRLKCFFFLYISVLLFV